MEETTSTSQEKQYDCWCKEINEAMARVGDEMSKVGNMLKGMGPSEQVQGHFRNSRIEFLKGVRQMLDEKIAKAQAASQHGTAVPVE